MSKSWHLLDINIDNAIRPKFNFDKLLKKSAHVDKFHWDMWTYRYEELPILLTEEWLEYMKSINLEISSALLFYRKPNFDSNEAHIDVPYNDNDIRLSCPINWVLGNDASDMIWYNMPDSSVQAIQLRTPTNDKYTNFSISELTEIDRRRIGNRPTLVRVDIPHVIVVRETPRWAISVRTKFKSSNWIEMVEYVKPYILNYQET